jgi:hypothetical protein
MSLISRDGGRTRDLIDIIMDIHEHKGGGGNGGAPNGGAANGTAAADLIGSMAAELAQLARHHGFDALGYLLDMARLEADNLTRAAKGLGGAN